MTFPASSVCGRIETLAPVSITMLILAARNLAITNRTGELVTAMTTRLFSFSKSHCVLVMKLPIDADPLCMFFQDTCTKDDKSLLHYHNKDGLGI